MAGYIKKAYIAVWAVMALLSVYYLFMYRNHVETPGDGAGGFEVLQPMEVLESSGGRDGLGEIQVVRLKLGEVTGNRCTLMFYSIHQNVTVYNGFNSIYSMKPARKNTFTRTPGCIWNYLPLDETMSGKEIRVEFTSVYPGISYELPAFYFGERGPIVRALFAGEIFPFSVSGILILIGLLFIGYVLFNFKNSEVDKNLSFLGLFAVFTGLWKICDLSMTKYILLGFPTFSMIPFIALMLVVIPCAYFIMDLHSTKDSKIWLIPCIVSLAVIYTALFLQYFNIADFRQMLIPILLVIVVGTIVGAYMVFVEFRRVGWNRKLRRNLWGLGIIILGVLADAGGYFLTGGRNSSYFGITGFLLYTVMHGLTIVRESGALIVAGEGAQSFENLAYHDKMTGCFNRSAFIVDTDPYVVEPEDYVVAVLDLNNLKVCNDTLGHERGDVYIKESAKIILATFGKIGSCYRMGGDEFYCLVPQGGLAACKEQKAALDKMVEEFNAKSSDIRMGIACGFAKYDTRLDYDLNATAKRADKAMYSNKENMKKQTK